MNKYEQTWGSIKRSEEKKAIKNELISNIAIFLISLILGFLFFGTISSANAEEIILPEPLHVACFRFHDADYCIEEEIKCTKDSSLNDAFFGIAISEMCDKQQALKKKIKKLKKYLHKKEASKK